MIYKPAKLNGKPLASESNKERWVHIMDEHLKQVTAELITERVNHYGKNETAAVNEAFMELRSSVERLSETLSTEQNLLLRACENAYRLSDGEASRFYYEAGFSDGIKFLMGWSALPSA